MLFQKIKDDESEIFSNYSFQLIFWFEYIHSMSEKNVV